MRLVVAVGSAGACGFALAQDPAGSGWTGLANPQDVIAARQAVMAELEQLMRPIDAFADGQPTEPDDVRAAAATIAPLLLATPHLFPPTTNLYDDAAEQPATLALPSVWSSFPAFYALGAAASAAATKTAALTSSEALRAASKELRATCDGCHAPYLRPYHASTVSEQDLEFDFESVLPK